MSLEKEYYIPSEVHIFLYILYVLSTDPYLIILDNILSQFETINLDNLIAFLKQTNNTFLILEKTNVSSINNVNNEISKPGGNVWKNLFP